MAVIATALPLTTSVALAKDQSGPVDISAACGSIAINGSVSDSILTAGCSPDTSGQLGEAIALLRALANQRDFDPELIRLVANGDHGPAVARLERLARTYPARAAQYLSAASAIELLGNRLPLASNYARRAFESAPNDAVLMIKYHGLLVMTGHRDDASKLLDISFRRRSQFGPVGGLYIEVAALDREFPPTIFWNWADETRICSNGVLGLQEFSERLNRPFGTCPLSSAAVDQVGRLRERAARIVAEFEKLATPTVTSRTMRYMMLNYILTCDFLLDPRKPPGSSATAVEEAGQELFRMGGPWAAAAAGSATTFVDLLLPEAWLQSRRKWYDQALEDAAAVPAISYDEADLVNRVLAPSANFAIGYYRLQRAWAHSIRDDHLEASRHGRYALSQFAASTPVGRSAPLAILVIDLLREAARELGPSRPPTDITNEFRALEKAVLKDVESVAPIASEVLSSRLLSCQAGLLQRTFCEDRSLQKAFNAYASRKRRPPSKL